MIDRDPLPWSRHVPKAEPSSPVSLTELSQIKRAMELVFVTIDPSREPDEEERSFARVAVAFANVRLKAHLDYLDLAKPNDRAPEVFRRR